MAANKRLPADGASPYSTRSVGPHTRTPVGDVRELRLSSLSRTVKCQRRLLHIDIYEAEEGGWLLTVTNEQRVTSHWAESFKTERVALRAALQAIKEEGLEGFHMEQPYKDLLQ